MLVWSRLWGRRDFTVWSMHEANPSAALKASQAHLTSSLHRPAQTPPLGAMQQNCMQQDLVCGRIIFFRATKIYFVQVYTRVERFRSPKIDIKQLNWKLHKLNHQYSKIKMIFWSHCEVNDPKKLYALPTGTRWKRFLTARHDSLSFCLVELKIKVHSKYT